MDVVNTLDVADRIMALQAVPMFSRLSVTDLEPIAEIVEERRYLPDETIFRRGDWEDYMVMIVSGEVRLEAGLPVVTRGPGEHIGELAMLRRRPRSLTAIAGPEGMHGLVMDCRPIEVLIEQRPEIAAGMLQTLAERLADAG